MRPSLPETREGMPQKSRLGCILQPAWATLALGLGGVWPPGDILQTDLQKNRGKVGFVFLVEKALFSLAGPEGRAVRDQRGVNPASPCSPLRCPHPT